MKGTFQVVINKPTVGQNQNAASQRKFIGLEHQNEKRMQITTNNSLQYNKTKSIMNSKIVSLNKVNYTV